MPMNKVKFFEEILKLKMPTEMQEFAKEILEKEIGLAERNAEKTAKVREIQSLEESIIMEFLQGQTVATPTTAIKALLDANEIKSTKSTSIMKRLVDNGQVEKCYIARVGGKPLTAYRVIKEEV